MTSSNQKILGYLKIIDNSVPLFSPGRKSSRLIKRRDEIVLEITRRDDKKSYYKDDPTAKYFMKKPGDIKELIPPTSCNRQIEVICGQDICDLSGFGRTININGGSTIQDDGEGDFGGGGPGPISGGGGVPCLSPPCINPDCPNPPCNEEDCGEGENYNEETGECEPGECQNPVGSGDCCFNADDGLCVYVTCYTLTTSDDSSNWADNGCCPPGTDPNPNDSGGCPCLVEIDGNTECAIVCPPISPPTFTTCAKTERYCYTGQDDSGNLVFSIEGSDVKFDPGSGRFSPPSNGSSPDADSCPSPPSCASCITCACGQPDGPIPDLPSFTRCENSEEWVGINPYDPPSDTPDPEYDDGLGAFFEGDAGICNDPGGSCTTFRSVLICLSKNDCQNRTSTYGVFTYPVCTVSWQPPSQEQPPELYPIPPGDDGGEWGSGWDWTGGGAAGGGPSTACDCGG